MQFCDFYAIFNENPYQRFDPHIPAWNPASTLQSAYQRFEPRIHASIQLITLGTPNPRLGSPIHAWSPVFTRGTPYPRLEPRIHVSIRLSTLGTLYPRFDPIPLALMPPTMLGWRPLGLDAAVHASMPSLLLLLLLFGILI